MKKNILKFSFLLVFLGLVCLPLIVRADEFGLSTAVENAGLSTSVTDLSLYVGTIIGTILSFIGVIFFALMVFGGFMWMTARGNEEQTKKALNTITAAVIGLVIIFTSYTLVSFVFQSPNAIKVVKETSNEVANVVGYCDSMTIGNYCNRLTTNDLCIKETAFCEWGADNVCKEKSEIESDVESTFKEVGLGCRNFKDSQSCSNDITVGYCQWYGLEDGCKNYCEKIADLKLINPDSGKGLYFTEWKFEKEADQLQKCIKSCEQGPIGVDGKCDSGYMKAHFCYNTGKVTNYKYGSCVDGQGATGGINGTYIDYIVSTTDLCIKKFDESGCKSTSVSAGSDNKCEWYVLEVDEDGTSASFNLSN